MATILEFTLPDIVIPLSNTLGRALSVDLGIPNNLNLRSTNKDNIYRGNVLFNLPNGFDMEIHFKALIKKINNPINEDEDIILIHLRTNVPRKWEEEGWIAKQFDAILFSNKNESVISTEYENDKDSTTIILYKEQIPLLIRGSRSFNRKTQVQLVHEANPPEVEYVHFPHLGG